METRPFESAEGEVKIYRHRPLQGDPKEVSLVKKASGWYAHISCELPDTPKVLILLPYLHFPLVHFSTASRNLSSVFTTLKSPISPSRYTSHPLKQPKCGTHKPPETRLIRKRSAGSTEGHVRHTRESNRSETPSIRFIRLPPES